MPSRDWNRQMWNDAANWQERGDEWDFHAKSTHQTYDAWKRSVVSTFIDPYVGPTVDMVELGSGHGRWAEFMVGRVRSLALVDLSENCIDACRERFGSETAGLSYIVNDGRTLPVADASLDLIWSFGTLVHVDASEIDSYLGEFRRVLRPGGRFVVHHAGWLEWNVGLVHQLGLALVARVTRGQWLGQYNRSAMSARRFGQMAALYGLHSEPAVRRWGPQGEFALAVGDVITTGVRSP